MEHSSLSEMISCIELGTKLHAGVIFLKNYGNRKTKLPVYQTIHSSPVCDHSKKLTGGLARCVDCRNSRLMNVISDRVPFSGTCINGVFEYWHPVMVENDVAAVIFIGNIFDRSSKYDLDQQLIDTMEKDVPLPDIQRTAQLIESYILFLFEKYPNTNQSGYVPLVQNIKNYIGENYKYEISLKDLGKLFSYNENYLGRLFKKETGMYITEYINRKKISIAKDLLLGTSKSITAIAAESGFNNVSYFNRVFRRVEQISPSEYRAQSK